jgi:fumarate hydratase class I
VNAVDRLEELIRLTSSSLPEDVEEALVRARGREKPGSGAGVVLQTILDNVALARTASTPLCQDTGTLTFFVDARLREDLPPAVVREAVERATARGLLRKNCIDSVTGRSHDDNCAPGAPVVHYVTPPSEAEPPRVGLLMKGGGSENMSRQYSLPDAALGAGRDLEGVRRCLLDAVVQAQGYGCAPGILGVCVGGDRATGYAVAKEQLLRPLSDASPDATLASLETRLLGEANALGIGPMGLGGATTLLGVKIASRPRVPASFFVTVAYLCWAARRRTMIWNGEEGGGR